VTRQVWRLDPATYPRHCLHQGDRVWPESNCSVDLWIELLYTRGLEPLAALPFTFALDFEGDQWTFFKFPLGDLVGLYGVDVIELSVWRPLIAHVDEQLGMARPCIVEVDAYYLPDTSGTSYHDEHVKTSIAMQALDMDARRLGYFHNAGYYELEGTDFNGLFRLDEGSIDPRHLPPYVEVVKFGNARLDAGTIVKKAIELLRGYLSRPGDNPFRRYSDRLVTDLHWLAHQPLSRFHAYAFATFRQCGAAFERGGAYLRWLEANGEDDLGAMAEACDRIAMTAKALQFKTARLVSAKRAFEHAPMVEEMAAAFDHTIAALRDRYSAVVHQE